MTWLKRWLRHFVLRLNERTSQWLNAKTIIAAIDHGHHDLARRLIAESRVEFGDDPELVRLESLNAFMDPERFNPDITP